MAKRSGLGSQFLVAGYDLSGDTNSLSRIGGGHGFTDGSAINCLGYERIPTRRDGGMDFTAFFNDDAGASHAVLSALPTTDVCAIWASAGTIGAPGAGLIAKQADYALALAADGALTASVTLNANNYGCHFGRMLTAGLQTDASATNSTGVDLAASTSFGLTAFLVVTSLGSGTPTVKIQDSADNNTFADVTNATFGTVDALDNEIVQTATGATVRRYVRVATTGTFSNLEFAVVMAKHTASAI